MSSTIQVKLYNNFILVPESTLCRSFACACGYALYDGKYGFCRLLPPVIIYHFRFETYSINIIAKIYHRHF